MRVAVTNAKGQLTELIRRAEAGKEVILTRRGRGVVRLVPVEAAVAPEARRELLKAVRSSGAAKARTGESAARSQDLLFGPDGEQPSFRCPIAQRRAGPSAPPSIALSRSVSSTRYSAATRVGSWRRGCGGL